MFKAYKREVWETVKRKVGQYVKPEGKKRELV